MIQQEQSEILPDFPNEAPAKCTGYPEVTPEVTPQGPRSLHFRGKRPIPRLPELASSSARPAAALRDHGPAHKGDPAQI